MNKTTNKTNKTNKTYNAEKKTLKGIKAYYSLCRMNRRTEAKKLSKIKFYKVR